MVFVRNFIPPYQFHIITHLCRIRAFAKIFKRASAILTLLKNWKWFCFWLKVKNISDCLFWMNSWDFMKKKNLENGSHAYCHDYHYEYYLGIIKHCSLFYLFTHVFYVLNDNMFAIQSFHSMERTIFSFTLSPILFQKQIHSSLSVNNDCHFSFTSQEFRDMANSFK